MTRIALAAFVAALLAAVPDAASAASTVTIRDSDRYGRYLTDGAGRTLYLFTRERGTASRCYGACARAWPPVLTRGTPRARGAARASLLGTTRRRDGSRQVTYGGHPVYYYFRERRAGQIFCQNVVEFGGTWLLVGPRGSAIR
jgi:predicted lipoprotein with Yx(FWY)xxD motif